MKKQITALLALSALTIIAAEPAFADPPPWAHGHRTREVVEVRPVVQEYRYVYYPARQVYYEPQQKIWFWMNGGSWQFGLNLPVQYRAYISSGVPVVLHSNRPYTEHVYVEQTYGRPWRAKHPGYGRDHGDHHERHDGHHERHDHHGHHGRD